jgi:hypothetical protein
MNLYTSSAEFLSLLRAVPRRNTRGHCSQGNKHFATIGYNLANKFSDSPLSPYDTYLGDPISNSFYFNAVSSYEIINEIQHIPENKSYGLYSCPVFILKLSRHILGPILANLLIFQLRPVYFHQN